jgi:hypothetical protein
MRTRLWLAGALLVGVIVASAPPPASAAIWPFSLFGAKKAPAKPLPRNAKSKKGKTAYGSRIKAVKPIYK